LEAAEASAAAAVALAAAARREAGSVDIRRILKHLMMTPWRERRAFPRSTLEVITHAIQASETAHAGQIRFAVEGALHGAALYHGQSPRERALDVFSQLRMWDTEYRNGVLIYLLLADSAVEIVADRGVHANVGTNEWQSIVDQMQQSFKAKHFEQGVVTGIQAITQHLMAHYPVHGDELRQLPDTPAVL
jgi:uncharacterized membrane protein